MCSLAPGRDALALGAATSFLDRQRGRGVAAAVAPAPATTLPSSRKRGRDVHPASSSAAALRVRMEKELVALQGLLKRAKLLPRSAVPAPPAEKKCDPSPRRSEAPAVPSSSSSSSSAKRRTTTSQPKAATEAEACQTQITAPAANSKQQHQPVQEKQQRRAEEEEKNSKDDLAARAAAREAFRQMLVEMEKAALPDETVYPEEMEELGIPFEFVITRTWKQACLDYQANKNKCKRAGQQAATPANKTLAAAPGPASRTIAAV